MEKDQQYYEYTPVLARPYANVSGHRHIPKLVNANRFPILRICKPQSPVITGLIRHSIRSREKRLARSLQMVQNIRMGMDEDAWDCIIRAEFGLLEPGGSWTIESASALAEIKRQHYAAVEKRKRISQQMTTIVEEEKALAQAERAKLRRNMKLKSNISKSAQDSREGETKANTGQTGETIGSTEPLITTKNHKMSIKSDSASYEDVEISDGSTRISNIPNLGSENATNHDMKGERVSASGVVR